MYLWLQQANNKKLVSIIIAGVIIFFCIFKYFKHAGRILDQSIANNYQIMSSAMQANDLVTVKNQAEDLIKYIDNPRTLYPKIAALFLAKLAILDHNLVEAEKNLRLVTDLKYHKNKTPIWHLANLRLIKVLLLQNKLTEVDNIKKIIEHDLPKSFASKYQELFGDFLLTNNETQKAHELYLQAIQNLPQQIPSILLDLKITETNQTPEIN